MLFEHKFYIERITPNSKDDQDYQELELVAKVWYVRGDPGGFWAPPADDDIDIEEILLKGKPWDGELTKEEEDHLEEECFEHARELIKSKKEDVD